MSWAQVGRVVHAEGWVYPLGPGDDVVDFFGAGVAAQMTDAGVRLKHPGFLLGVEVFRSGALVLSPGHLNLGMMGGMNETTVPPGWYPVSGGHGYWDGSRWTGSFIPAQLPPPMVVVARDPYATNHILHLLLTVFTLGLWAPVWLIVAVVNNNNRAKAVRAAAELQARQDSGQHPGQ